VPADLTSAKLKLATPGFSCASGGTDYPFTASGEATVDMTLPQD
jgi:hypothetical protein